MRAGRAGSRWRAGRSPRWRRSWCRGRHTCSWCCRAPRPAAHFDLAWGGFDLGLLVLLALTGVGGGATAALARRRRRGHRRAAGRRRVVRRGDGAHAGGAVGRPRDGGRRRAPAGRRLRLAGGEWSGPGGAPAGPRPESAGRTRTTMGTGSAYPAVIGRMPDMSAAPSVSNSITVRLTLPARATAVSELTGVIEKGGGLVTGLDVTASGADRLRVDVTAAARDTDHADELVEAMRGVHGVEIGKVSDRTFLVHLGGKLKIESKVPIRNRDDLSLIYTPGVARVCMAIAENPADARRLTIKRNTVAVVTDGSAVLGLGNIGPLARAAGDGGQGRAVQAVRRHRRLPDLPRHPGHRGDHPHRQGDQPGLRRHQPRGHLRAALLRDRGAAARRARHPGLPRRPARHRDRHPRRAAQRAARGRQGARASAASSCRGAGAAGTAILKLLLKAGATDVVVADQFGVLHADRDDIAVRASTRRWPGRPSTPTSAASPAPSRRRSPAPTCSSASPPRASSPATTSPP